MYAETRGAQWWTVVEIALGGDRVAVAVAVAVTLGGGGAFWVHADSDPASQRAIEAAVEMTQGSPGAGAASLPGRVPDTATDFIIDIAGLCA